jgi:serine protease DegQ
MRLAVKSVAVLCMIAALVLGGCSSSSKSSSNTTPAADPPTSAGGFTFDQIPPLVQRVEPQVVSVVTDTGVGSGVVWASNGTIVTNNHVIANASHISVSFADGKSASARVLGTDAYSDIAVLHADRTNLPAATWETSEPPVGAFVLAIGSPLGLQNTVTQGIVSALGRTLPGASSTVDLIQTDAPISPGNSGGALVDEHGQVAGMNAAYIPPTVGAVAIGLAIPAQTVTSVVRQLLKNGRVEHAFLGVQPATLTPDIAQQLGVPARTGVIVLQVVSNSPADRAGIRVGDVLVQFGNQQLQTAEDLLLALRQAKVGDRVPVTYIDKNGKRYTVTVTLTQAPSKPATAAP